MTASMTRSCRTARGTIQAGSGSPVASAASKASSGTSLTTAARPCITITPTCRPSTTPITSSGPNTPGRANP